MSYNVINKQLTYPLSGSFTGSLLGTASYALNAGSGGTVSTASLLTTASVFSNTITFIKGDGSTFPITVATGSGGGSSFPYTGSAIISGSLVVTGSTTSTLGFTGSLFGTSSWASNVVSASYAATASYINFNIFQITTGSITASVNTAPNNLFLIQSGSNVYLNISSSSNTTLYSDLFVIKNFTTQKPVLTVSQSIVQFATQSTIPIGITEAGSIWFTSSSLYIGLE